MELQGKVIKILEPTTYTSKKDGSKQFIFGFVIETSGDYPSKVCMQVFGTDRWTQFKIQVGASGTFMFNVASREYKERWYTELTCYRVSIGSNATSGTVAAPAQTQQAMPEAESSNNLPF